MDKKSVIEMVLHKALEANGGTMTGKTILILVIAGVLVILGILGYRLLIMEMLTHM